jgi:hypothetical protein
VAVKNLGSGADKLTFQFNQKAEFRHEGKKIDLEKAKDELKVIGKDGKEKTIKGFLGSDGLFYALKKTQNGVQINVYGEPADMKKQQFHVNGGDITRARFNDIRYRKDDPDDTAPKQFQVSGTGDPDKFAKLYGLIRRPDAGLNAGAPAGAAPQPPVDKDVEPPPVAKPAPVAAQQAQQAALGVGAPANKPPPQDAARPVFKKIEDIDWLKKDGEATKIYDYNKESLKQLDGIGQVLTSDDLSASLTRKALADKIAAKYGIADVPDGASPLDYLDLGDFTVADLKGLIKEQEQSPPGVLKQIGLKPIETLGGVDSFYGALAKGIHGTSSTDTTDASAARKQLLFQLSAVETSQDEGQLNELADGLKGQDRKEAFKLLRETLEGNLASGGEASLKLAAINSKAPVVTISDQGNRIYSPDGTYREFARSDTAGFKQAFNELADPAVLMQNNGQWFATDKL